MKHFYEINGFLVPKRKWDEAKRNEWVRVYRPRSQPRALTRYLAKAGKWLARIANRIISRARRPA